MSSSPYFLNLEVLKVSIRYYRGIYTSTWSHETYTLSRDPAPASWSQSTRDAVADQPPFHNCLSFCIFSLSISPHCIEGRKEWHTAAGVQGHHGEQGPVAKRRPYNSDTYKNQCCAWQPPVHRLDLLLDNNRDTSGMHIVVHPSLHCWILLLFALLVTTSVVHVRVAHMERGKTDHLRFSRLPNSLTETVPLLVLIKSTLVLQRGNISVAIVDINKMFIMKNLIAEFHRHFHGNSCVHWFEL